MNYPKTLQGVTHDLTGSAYKNWEIPERFSMKF